MSGTFAAQFLDIGLVKSAELKPATRVACLSPVGINLLQQRLIWHLARFSVPTHLLNQARDAVFEEANLNEDWIIELTDRGVEWRLPLPLSTIGLGTAPTECVRDRMRSRIARGERESGVKCATL